MTKYINLKVISCLLFTAVSAGAVSAQETGVISNTAASIERIKAQDMWLNSTNNAAGAFIDDVAYYANANLFYRMTDGTFKRPQIGKKNTGFGFSTDGGGFLDKKKNFYAWGDFNYSRDKIREAQYNISLIDPLRGMPFIIADERKSNWINQDFNMQVKAAARLYGDKLFLGFKGKYEVANGAKQKDPRPNIQMSRVEVMPSLLLKMGRHSVGANFDYYSRREYGEPMTKNNRTPHIGWIMVAPGFFREVPLGSGSTALTVRDYNANNLGGGLQYGYTAEQVKIVFSGNYSYVVEDARTLEDPDQSTERSQMAGTTRQNNYDVNLNARFNNGSGSDSWYLNLHWEKNDMDGIEYLQKFDNRPDIMEYVVTFKSVRSNYKVDTFKGDLSFMRNDGGNSYRWTVGAGGEYKKLGNIYYLPRSTQDIESLTANAYAKKNFHTGRLSRLLVGLNATASKNLSSEVDYNGFHSDNIGYTDFTLKDVAYLSTSYWGAGAEATYSHMGIIKNTALYAGVVFDYYRAHGYRNLFNNRTYLTFKLGMTF